MPHKSAPRSYGEALAERNGTVREPRKTFADLAVGSQVFNQSGAVVGRVVGYGTSAIYLKLNNGLSATVPGRAANRQSTWIGEEPVFCNPRPG